MILHRIVKAAQPNEDDFLSQKAKGLRLRDDQYESIWDGISVWETIDQARETAAGSRYRLGSYVAVLDVPETGPVRWQRTTKSEGHYTLWGQPADLLALVQKTVPLQAEV